jgi:hypothetical protein
MAHTVVVFDQDINIRQFYLSALQDVSVCGRTSYQVAVVHTLADVQSFAGEIIDLAIVAMRHDRQVRSLLPLLDTLVDTNRMLLLVACGAVTRPYVLGMTTLGCPVLELPVHDSVLRATIADMMNVPHSFAYKARSHTNNSQPAQPAPALLDF